MFGVKSSLGVACALATMLLFPNQGVAREILRIGGTGAINGMVNRLGPLGKTLYVVFFATQSPSGKRFLAFLGSQKGAAALRDADVLPGAAANPSP